jgi:hypothetical protein
MRIPGFAVLFVCFYTTTVWAQKVEKPPIPVTQPSDTELNMITDFRPLFEERETLVEEIRNDEQTIDELSARVRQLPTADVLEEDVKTAKSDLK